MDLWKLLVTKQFKFEWKRLWHRCFPVNFQKQQTRGVFSKRCSENMLQIYRRTPMPKCYFNKVAKNTSERLLLNSAKFFRTSFFTEQHWWLILFFIWMNIPRNTGVCFSWICLVKIVKSISHFCNKQQIISASSP